MNCESNSKSCYSNNYAHLSPPPQRGGKEIFQGKEKVLTIQSKVLNLANLAPDIDVSLSLVSYILIPHTGSDRLLDTALDS